MGDESWRPDWPISCQRRWLRFWTWHVPSTQPTRSNCACCSRPTACRRPRACRWPCRGARRWPCRWPCWGARRWLCRGMSFGWCRGMSSLCRGAGRAPCRGASRGAWRGMRFGPCRGTSGLCRGPPAGCSRAGDWGPGWPPSSEAGEGLRSGGSLQESGRRCSAGGTRGAAWHHGGRGKGVAMPCWGCRSGPGGGSPPSPAWEGTPCLPPGRSAQRQGEEEEEEEVAAARDGELLPAAAHVLRAPASRRAAVPGAARPQPGLSPQPAPSHPKPVGPGQAPSRQAPWAEGTPWPPQHRVTAAGSPTTCPHPTPSPLPTHKHRHCRGCGGSPGSPSSWDPTGVRRYGPPSAASSSTAQVGLPPRRSL